MTFCLFFFTYHLSLAHCTVGEGTEALKCNSWWLLLRLFHAFSSKNSWLLPRVQNYHMRFKGMKIFCLSIVMSCSHDDGILVSFPVYRVAVNSSFEFSQKRKAMTWFKINDEPTCYCISSFLCKVKAAIFLNWCVRANSVKLWAMRIGTANTSGKSSHNSETSQS